MELVRQYKNASGYEIRIDTIFMVRRQNTIASNASTHTFYRQLKVRPVISTNVTDREVAEVEVIGDFDELDTTNFEWAKWSSPVATLDMSDLPFVGDTV